MNKEYFFEEQKFTWIWPLLIPAHFILLFMVFYGNYKQLVKGEVFGNTPMSDTGLVLFSLSLLIFFILLDMLLLKWMKLQTKINKEGIFYRYPPLINHWKQIKTNEIENYEVGKYNAFLEFGGWGYRYSFFRKKGKALNVYGNKGLIMQLKNGNRLVIGTQKEAELKKAMHKLMHPITEIYE